MQTGVLGSFQSGVEERIKLRCIECKKSIPTYKIKRHFLCPYCGVELKPRSYDLALVVAIVFWFLIFAPVQYLFFGFGVIGILIDFIIGGILAALIFEYILFIGEKRSKD